MVLVSNRHGQGNSDPVRGSRFQCVGTVVSRSLDSDGPLRVKWDNDHENIYRSKDLLIYSDKEMRENPNFTFKRQRKAEVKTAEERLVEISPTFYKKPFSKGLMEELDVFKNTEMTDEERSDVKKAVGEYDGSFDDY